MTGHIYKIVNKTNGKYYVGSSIEIDTRIRTHKRELSYNRHHCIGLQRAWNKYGKDNFDFIIVESSIPTDNLLIIEQNYLDKAKLERENCYNSNMSADKIEWKDGINPMLGKHHSDKTKQLMRQRQLGKVLTDEHKMKISNAGVGKVPSFETRIRISNALKGRKCSESTKQKLREARLKNLTADCKPSN